MRNDTQAYAAVTNTHVTSIQDHNQALSLQGTHEDIPTGMTPRKRVWEYVDQWEITKSREALLQDYRKQSAFVSDSSNHIFGALHHTEDTGDEEMGMEPVIVVKTEPDVDLESRFSIASPDRSADSIPFAPLHVAPPKPMRTASANGILKTAPIRTLSERSTNILGGRGGRKFR